MRCLHPFAFLLLVGCYRYAPSPTPTPAAGAHVRFTLADSSLTTVQRVLGDRTIGVEGHVLAVTDSMYMLNVTATVKKGLVGDPPNRVVWAGESVGIPRSAVT